MSLTSHRSNPFYDGREPNVAALEQARTSINQFGIQRNISYVGYSPRRKQRYLLVADRLKDYINGRVLDVGTRDKTLSEVTGVDAELVDKNNPNLPEFDWEISHLPFDDCAFDSVVCLDTLEHINRLHVALDDLLRVSKKHVIISLPNCWRKVAKDMIAGVGRVESYGLPLENPKDRHRWFFNTEEAVALIAYRGALHPGKYAVQRVIFHTPKNRAWHRFAYPILLALLPTHFKNILIETVFVVLQRSTK